MQPNGASHSAKGAPRTVEKRIAGRRTSPRPQHRFCLDWVRRHRATAPGTPASKRQRQGHPPTHATTLSRGDTARSSQPAACWRYEPTTTPSARWFTPCRTVTRQRPIMPAPEAATAWSLAFTSEHHMEAAATNRCPGQTASALHSIGSGTLETDLFSLPSRDSLRPVQGRKTRDRFVCMHAPSLILTKPNDRAGH